MVGRRPQQAVSKLPCLVLSSVISCRSSICPGRLSPAWLVSLVVVSCHMVSKWWHARSIGRLWGGWYTLPRTISFVSHCWLYLWLCPLPDPDVGLSIFVCDVELTSFHFGLCCRKFVLCLCGQCPGLYTICHSWQHTGVVHLFLQADGKVACEGIPVFGVCRPACHDSSLYLFVLVLFLEAVVLSQVHAALDIFYQHIVHVYRRVVYNHHICLCTIFILRPFRLLSSDSSCSICCSYCGVSVHRNMSSAKRRLERHFPSIFTSLLLVYPWRIQLVARQPI